MKFRLSFLLFLTIFFTSLKLSAQNVEIIKKEELRKILNPNNNVTYVINFWATWCRPCVAEIPYFEKIAQEYKDKNVKFIFVAVEDEFEKVEKFIKLKNIQSSVLLLDEARANEWIPMVNETWEGEIPVTLFVNKEKNKREFHTGKISEEALKKYIELSIN